MNNQMELMPSDGLSMAFEQMSPEARDRWLEIQIEKKREREIRALRGENEAMRRDIEMFRAEQDAKNEEVADGLRKVADASARRLKNADEYYVRTILGKVFAPEVSAKRMTKLLRVVGIVGVHGDPIADYRKGAEPLAKPKPFSEYPTWLFHARKVMKRIDTWMQENGWYEDFHNTTTKDERDAFIDMLFEEYT